MDPSGSVPFFVLPLVQSFARASAALGGVVAGEGCFGITTKQPPFVDGSPRLRFVFQVTMVARDAPLLHALSQCLGHGSLHRRAGRRPGWQPTVTLQVGSARAHRRSTIPFFEQFLPPTAKRAAFELWRDAFRSYELLHPPRWGEGRASCSQADCDEPVRGQGLCRSHYHHATGH